jgi:pimeloyl-ACP methyl ester carboxylesterase
VTRYLTARRFAHLAYVEAGAADAPPLFLLHGGTMTATWNWAEAIPALADRYRVIAPDSPGHGHSANPRPYLRYEDMAEDVLALAEALDLSQAAFYGFSDGAQVALELAAREPAFPTALVLSAVMHKLGPGYYPSMHKTVGEDGYAGDGWEPAHTEAAAEFRARHDDWDALAPQIWDLWTRPIRLSADHVSRVRASTLLLVGDRDPFVGVEQTVELFRMLRQAELAVIPGAGHEYDERFTTVAREFLRRHVPRHARVSRPAGAAPGHAAPGAAS